MASAAYLAEVERLNERFLVEYVERFGLCPFARAAREGGEVARTVLFGPPSAEAAAEAFRALAARPEIVIGLLVFPDAWPLVPPGGAEAAAASEAFDGFVASLRAAVGTRPPFACAPFHPAATYRGGRPAELVPLFRRAPDPTIQLVRFEVLEAAKKGTDTFFFDGSPAAWAELARRAHAVPLSDRIAAANAETVQARGERALLDVLTDFAADRARSYAPFRS